MSGQKAEEKKKKKVITKKKVYKYYMIQEVKPVITFRAKELFDDLCFH